MAVVIISETKQRIDEQNLKAFLATTGIEFERWDLVPEMENNTSGDAILAAYDEKVQSMKRRGNYKTVDVLNVTAATPGLEEKMRPFSVEHWHTEDEVRFTLHGGGVFHIHPLDKPVFTLEVEAGDMISIPAGVLHWFDICSHKRLLAIRFFQDPKGWEPHYTESLLERQYASVCFGLNPFMAHEAAD